jgi:hypothetical protein
MTSQPRLRPTQTAIAYKSWAIGSLDMVQEQRLFREANYLGQADLVPVCRSFVHSAPTHKEIRLTITGKTAKKAIAAGFHIHGYRV